MSFGLDDGTLADHQRIRDGHGDDAGRLDRIANHVVETLLEGAFEVIEQVEPA